MEIKSGSRSQRHRTLEQNAVSGLCQDIKEKTAAILVAALEGNLLRVSSTEVNMFRSLGEIQKTGMNGLTHGHPAHDYKIKLLRRSTGKSSEKKVINV